MLNPLNFCQSTLQVHKPYFEHILKTVVVACESLFNAGDIHANFIKAFYILV